MAYFIDRGVPNGGLEGDTCAAIGRIILLCYVTYLFSLHLALSGYGTLVSLYPKAFRIYDVHMITWNRTDPYMSNTPSPILQSV